VCKRLARDFEIGQQPLWNRKYSVYASIQHQFEPAQKKRIILSSCHHHHHHYYQQRSSSSLREAVKAE